MIQRNSNAVDFSSGQDQASYTQAGGGYVNPTPKKSIGDGGSSANSALLQNILSDVKGLMDVGVSTSREEAYLAGAAKAATGEAEAAVESSFTTRDWATAGYRDTVGKLKMADADASLPEDMQRLRELPPEKMNEYLAERRAKLAPSLEGMSRAQRTAAFGQMLLSDRAAIATHAKENMAYRIEQVVTTKQTEFRTYKTSLDNALKAGKGPEYDAEVKKFTLGYIGGSIMSEGRFDAATKQNMAVQAIDDVLGSGNVKVYEVLLDTVVPDDINDPTGPSHPALGVFSLDNQRKLSNSYRSARDATAGARTLDLHNRVSHALAAYKTGTDTRGLDGVKELQQEILADDKNNIAFADSVMRAFLEGSTTKYPNKAQVIANAAAGKVNANAALGVSDSEGVAATVKDWGEQGVKFDTQVAQLVVMSGKSVAAAKELGSRMDNTMLGLNMTDTLPQEDKQVLGQVLTHMATLKLENNQAAMANVFAGMGDIGAKRLRRLMAQPINADPTTALAAVKATEDRERSMSPETKAENRQEAHKLMKKYTENIAPTGITGYVISHIPFIGGQTANQNELSARTSPFSLGSALNNQYHENALAAMQQEMQASIDTDDTLPPEQHMQVAEAKLLQRTLRVGNVPVIFPQGQTPLTALMGPGKVTASPEQLSHAVEYLSNKVDKNNTIAYSMDGNQLLAKEYTEAGAYTGRSTRIDPKDVRQNVANQMDKKLESANEAVGTGAVVVVGGKSLRVNGANTAAMSNTTMVEARKALAVFEGLTVGVQQDVGKQLDKFGKPVMTTGMGLSSTNTYFKQATEAKTPEDHLAVFVLATDEAARNGMKLTSALNLRGEGWNQLATELMYQSGAGTIQKHESYKDFFNLVSTPVPRSRLSTAMNPSEDENKRRTEALALLEKTPAYSMSKPPRQRHYKALLMKAFYGEY